MILIITVSEFDVIKLKDGSTCTVVDGDSIKQSEVLVEFDPIIDDKWITWIKVTDIDSIIYKDKRRVKYYDR